VKVLSFGLGRPKLAAALVWGSSRTLGAFGAQDDPGPSARVKVWAGLAKVLKKALERPFFCGLLLRKSDKSWIPKHSTLFCKQKSCRPCAQDLGLDMVQRISEILRNL